MSIRSLNHGRRTTNAGGGADVEHLDAEVEALTSASRYSTTAIRSHRSERPRCARRGGIAGTLRRCQKCPLGHLVANVLIAKVVEHMKTARRRGHRMNELVPTTSASITNAWKHARVAFIRLPAPG